MDWFLEMEDKLHKNNQILFTKNNEIIIGLNEIIEKQTHRTMILWAFGFAEETVKKLQERYPNESRLQQAVTAAKAWAAGAIKMPAAQRAILQAHAVAKGIHSLEDIALCHAVGQACSVVHTCGHAVGFPIYDLTAIVRRYGAENCREAVEGRTKQYIEKMELWRQNSDNNQYIWADFIKKD